MKDFWYYYLRSMRLYYCFITGTSTLVGCMFCHGFRDSGWDWRDAAVLTIGFLAWGVNQVVSDWFDRKEDAFNAPHRPMVTGELAPLPALVLSGSLMALFAVTAYLVSPLSLLILLVGGLLNVLYSVLKWVPVLNTLIYGAAITCCTLFGASAHWDFVNMAFYLFMILPLVLLSHILMCHNSYFKDIEGDRAAGLWTLPVLFPKFSFWLGLVLSTGWTLLLYLNPLMAVLLFAGNLHRATCTLLSLFNGLQTVGFVLLMFYLNLRLFVSLWKKEYHRATKLNCQLCTVWLWSIPGIFFERWLIGPLVSVLLIELIYRWYPDEKE